MKKLSKNPTAKRIRYWMFFALEIMFLLLLMVIAVTYAIRIADYKMNVMYPDMCSCDYPAGTLPQADIIQCTFSCAKMRNDERSLTIGFLSVCLFFFLETLYYLIKGRVQQSKWIKRIIRKKNL